MKKRVELPEESKPKEYYIDYLRDKLNVNGWDARKIMDVIWWAAWLDKPRPIGFEPKNYANLVG